LTLSLPLLSLMSLYCSVIVVALSVIYLIAIFLTG
jgi:hypothetical protein